MKALIVADGDVPADVLGHPLLTAAEPELVVAADGGALKAEALGLRVGVVVGDLDSLTPADVARLAAGGTEVLRHPAAKNESDTELALLEARRRGARVMFVIGALGGSRFDHALANVLLLGLPALADCEVVLLDAAGSVRALGGRGPASVEVEGRSGDVVSLLPLSTQVEGVSTEGLAYPLSDEPLAQGPTRGLSNVLLRERATISLRAGRLAVIHHAPAGPESADV
ncbi:MAG TPA: thiamine diphosphokinase [Candidatus Limnocylindria bacterium]|nr:thiamine diphosphokinase [Candidatus Limnocylindria bacterium]